MRGRQGSSTLRRAADFMTTAAQKQAQARYDAKRPAPLPVRLNEQEIAWLDARRQPGEGRATALKRLAGVGSERE